MPRIRNRRKQNRASSSLGRGCDPWEEEDFVAPNLRCHLNQLDKDIQLKMYLEAERKAVQMSVMMELRQRDLWIKSFFNSALQRDYDAQSVLRTLHPLDRHYYARSVPTIEAPRHVRLERDCDAQSVPTIETPRHVAVYIVLIALAYIFLLITFFSESYDEAVAIFLVGILPQAFHSATNAASWTTVYLRDWVRDWVLILAQAFHSAASFSVHILSHAFYSMASAAFWTTTYLNDLSITITVLPMMLLALVIGMLWVVLKTSTEEDSTAVPVEDEPDKALSKVDANDQCVVCLDAEQTRVFAPCGHICCCDECCDRIMNSSKVCPLCRQPCTWGGRMYKG